MVLLKVEGRAVRKQKTVLVSGCKFALCVSLARARARALSLGSDWV